MMIRTAKEVWDNQSNRNDFERCCESVMRAIDRASERGLRECVFNPPIAEHYHATKTEFAKHGYTFHPTGYVGGVRQDSEQICW